MKRDKNIFQKVFASMGFIGGARVPLRSNVFGARSGKTAYNPIGSSLSRIFDMGERDSPLLGNAQPSKRISGWYERMSEIRQYELLDISRLAVSVFKDYVNNFLNTSSTQMVTILDEEGNTDDITTTRINGILSKDIKLFDYIRDHLDESIFYGSYYSMITTKRDDLGHLKFNISGLYDPIGVIIRRSIDPETDSITEEFIARGEDGGTYVIPSTECFYLGSPNLRLINDLQKDFVDYGGKPSEDKFALKGQENRKKVLQKEYYTAGEPIFYSTILKVKELVVKELLISLLSLRDLISPSLYGLSIDKGVPLETAMELCTKVQKMSTTYAELSSFLSSQFDVTSLIESALTQNIKFFPDYNATLQNKGALSLDKLSDKLIEVMQTIDINRQNVLNPLGIPLSMIDGTSGSKWQVLQQSERLNSRVNAIMTGISESVNALVGTIYKVLYEEDLDPSRIKLHILEKSTVEYNNTLNTLDNISGLVNGISGILNTSLQTLEAASPLLDPEKFITYIRNMIKDADPSAADIIDEETMVKYINLLQAKYKAQLEQLGLESNGDI